eukprot:4101121-Pyramimonas_sp.AAC.1
MSAVTHAVAATGAFGGAPICRNETCEECNKMCAATPVVAATGAFGGTSHVVTKRVRVCQRWCSHTCSRDQWGIRWNSLWGHKACEGRTKMRAVTHAVAVTRAFGGAADGATKTARCVSEWARSPCCRGHWGPSVELPMGPRSV